MAAQPAAWLNEAMNVAGEWTWPAQWVSVPAPPKAPLSARVVTPKLEPGDTYSKQQQTSIPPSSSVARTLSLTPTASPLPLPPTSPMKKDLFKFPGVGAAVAGGDHSHDRRSTVIGVKLQKIGQEPTSNSFAHFGPVLSGMRSRHSSGAPSADPRKNLMSPSTMTDPLNTPPPAKPADKVRIHIYYIYIKFKRSVIQLVSSISRNVTKSARKIVKFVVYFHPNRLPKISKKRLMLFHNRGFNRVKERPVVYLRVGPTVFSR